MNNIDKNWIEYWNTETIFKDKLRKKDNEIFFRNISFFMDFTPNDVVLDVGCGKCYLADLLKDKVKEVHCIDTSDRYLSACRKKLGKEENVFFYKMDEKNYTDLSFLKNVKFTKILCLSLIQYYKNIYEVKDLIRQIQKTALPGSILLIADII